jgi:Cfr10I/Bse634I restriction endonuclease
MSIYTRANGDTVAIESQATFLAALTKCDPYNLDDFNHFFKICEDLIKSEAAVTTGALSNVRGSWYEWLIALHAIKFARDNIVSAVMVKLPNVASFDCSRLFVDETFNLVEDLRAKVKQAEDVSLITSNPDFCLIKRNRLPDNLPSLNGLADLVAVDQLYQTASRKCHLDDIVSYVAVKTSLRPDRRLQISHEGSLIKALYKHIQTRNWLIDAPGVKFYAFTQKYNPADAKGLKTVATHSIIDVSSRPQSAVDKMFRINSSSDIFNALQEISTQSSKALNQLP